MFVILDTNHISAVDRYETVARDFERRAIRSGAELFICVISVEEIMRGWLALLASRKKRQDEIGVYRRLKRSTEMFAQWEILEWDDEALGIFEGLRRQKLKMSTADMKIASIVLAHDALLLTQNLDDFANVPGLRMENWLS
jgi:tRNA(fMet)-specific endonuclease VapC